MVSGACPLDPAETFCYFTGLSARFFAARRLWPSSGGRLPVRRKHHLKLPLAAHRGLSRLAHHLVRRP